MQLPGVGTPPSWRTLFTRYLVAWIFLAGVVIGEIVLATISARQGARLLQLASTNVTNLTHDPVAVIVASAYLSQRSLIAWLVLIPLAMFGANRAVGNWLIALICAAGHVIGTLVSEGIQAYRVAHGLLPHSAGNIIDVGPSYVVVSAIVVAVMFGSWPARIAALIDFAILVLVGDIFDGLIQLQVAAVGHLTAIGVAAVSGGLLAWRRHGAAHGQLSGQRLALVAGHGTGPAPMSPAASNAVRHRAEGSDEESDRPVPHE